LSAATAGAEQIRISTAPARTPRCHGRRCRGRCGCDLLLRCRDGGGHRRLRTTELGRRERGSTRGCAVPTSVVASRLRVSRSSRRRGSSLRTTVPADEAHQLGNVRKREPIGHPIAPHEGVPGDLPRAISGDDLIRRHGTLIIVGDADGPFVARGCACRSLCEVGRLIHDARGPTVIVVGRSGRCCESRGIVAVDDDRCAALLALDLDDFADDFFVGNRVLRGAGLAQNLHRVRSFDAEARAPPYETRSGAGPEARLAR
jgi:hypothetical protein